MGRYKFHARNSDVPFMLVDFSFRKGAYGDFDYRVLFEDDTFSAYLSEEGIKQARRLGEKLLEDGEYASRIILRMRRLVGRLGKLGEDWRDVEVTADNVVDVWDKIAEILEEFAQLYRYCEQPMLAHLEEVIEKKELSGTELNRLLENVALADEYGFEPVEKRALELLVELGKLKFQMHKELEVVYKLLSKVVRFVARKHGLSPEQVLAMRVKELGEAVRVRRVIDVNVLRDRLKGSVFVPSDNGEVWQCLTGRDFQEWKKVLEGADRWDSEAGDVAGVISGTIANSGKATGLVKLYLSILKGSKIPRGSVLVTGMTNPQIMPYLKNAVAIVTDEGGLTCHAAIVSREMDIPCIVGTGNATQLLKDGDEVEVDADEGVVRKLN